MTVRRILFASGAANLGGLQSSTHSRMLALKNLGIHSEKLFLKTGAGAGTYADVPLHITRRRSEMVRIMAAGNFDAVSMINRTDLLPALRAIGYRGRILFEVRGKAKHALKVLPTLQSTHVGAILVISRYVRDLVEPVVRDKSIPIRVLYNAVDTNLFRPLLYVNRKLIPYADDANRRPIILWVGRLSRNKNYTAMLDIAQLLQHEVPRPIFWVISDTRAKDGRSPFRAAVKERGLQQHVRLFECVPHRHMVHFYNLVGRSGGCVLSTSRSEGYQNSLLEAMACGVPVVSSAVGGNVELIEDRVTGRLYTLDQPQEAAEALSELLHYPTLRQAYTKESLKWVRREHAPEAHARRFLELLESTPILHLKPPATRSRAPKPRRIRSFRKPARPNKPTTLGKAKAAKAAPKRKRTYNTKRTRHRPLSTGRHSSTRRELTPLPPGRTRKPIRKFRGSATAVNPTVTLRSATAKKGGSTGLLGQRRRPQRVITAQPRHRT